VPSLNIQGTEYVVQVALKLKADSTNPNCNPYTFAALRRAAVEEAYAALKTNPAAGLIKRSMITFSYMVGSPLPDDPNNSVGGSVQYDEIGVFSMYVNVPVGLAFTAEFAKTAGVMDTLECIAENKRVSNAMPA
jgi:hypothetical protein